MLILLRIVFNLSVVALLMRAIITEYNFVRAIYSVREKIYIGTELPESM